MAGQILNYADLYSLCEELQQLIGGLLQGVIHSGPTRIALEIRLLGESRLLILDLAPARPFIVSTSYTKLKALTKKTPTLNFLKAHFLNTRLEALEIAQKPNRTVRLVFTGEKEIIFKCFPHGQHLVIKADGKVVNFPLRPKEDEAVTYISPELVKSWNLNEALAEDFMSLQVQNKNHKEPYHLALIKKLEKALAALEKGIADQGPLDLERIEVLEKEAQSSSGDEIQGIFEEIKRIKKKGLIATQRKLDLLAQIEKIKSDPTSVSSKSAEPVRKDKSKIFSGTRVRLSAQWELWVGRNAWQNEDLLKLGSSHELWLHLRDYPGAHGLIRGPKNSEPTQGQIETAALIVAILSQSKKRPFSEGEKLDVIVTPKKFVKKRKGDAPGRVIVEREKVRRIAFKSIKFEVISS